MKKPRRLRITIDVDTTLTVAQLRHADRIAIGSSQGGNVRVLYRHPPSVGDVPHRLVQVQATAVKRDRSEQGRREARAELAKKFASECETWPAKKLRDCYAQPETVAAAEKRERKAKRAKGAK